MAKIVKNIFNKKTLIADILAAGIIAFKNQFLQAEKQKQIS